MLNPLSAVIDNGFCISDAIDLPRVISRNLDVTEVELPLLNNTRGRNQCQAASPLLCGAHAVLFVAHVQLLRS